MKKRIDGITVNFIAVVHGKRVDNAYVRDARKRFKLTPKDGVSDKEFNKA